MILIVRKGIWTSGAIKTSPSQVMSVLDKIAFSPEVTRIITKVFRQPFLLYHTGHDFVEQPIQNAVYLGYADDQLFSFYTYSSKPVISLQ
jgi:hypothetical protein